MSDIVLVTGGFDPLHSGHIAYFKEARKLGKKLVVGVNSDEWLVRKKGKPFMPFQERCAIIQELACVDQVLGFNDSDDSACHAIFQLLSTHGSGTKIVFANGGDRTNTNTPEYATYGNTHYVDFKFGVGGEHKANSSSWILDEWKTQKTKRDWGYWRVLDDKQPRIGQKVKELVIYPGKSLSDQRHNYRSELWYVLEGEIQIDLEFPDGNWQVQMLTPNTDFLIRPNWWHKTTNTGNVPAHIVEIQFGEQCSESDIERRNHDK